jgi:predicted LPLAT superfamily acyltransferase
MNTSHATPDTFRPCVVIPAYNHPAALEKKVAQLCEQGLAVFLVNDGSTDQTAAVIDELANRFSAVVTMHRRANGGKGAAVKDGLRAAHAAGFTHALQIDADDQHTLSDIPHFLQLAETHPDSLIAGYPQYDDTLPAARRYGRYITHFWVWLETLSLSAIRDSMCGFRVYPLQATCDVLQRESIGDRMDFDIDIIVKMHWAGVPIINTPTRVTYPVDGISHFRMLQDNLRITRMHTVLVLRLLLLWLPGKILAKNRQEKSSHWSTEQERGNAFWLTLSVRLYQALGRPFGLLMAYAGTAYFFLFGKTARNASHDFLQTLYCYSHGATPSPTLANSCRQFFNLADAVMDRFGCWFGDVKRQDFDCANTQVFIEQSRTGKGGLLLCSHLGNAELASMLAEGLPDVYLNILVHTRHAEQLTRLLHSVATRQQCEFLQVDTVGVDTAIYLREKMDRGEWVVIAADRTPVTGTARTSILPFLGRPAAFAQGPFILAGLMECPVYTLFCMRKPAGGYTVYLDKFADTLKSHRATRSATLLAAQLRYVALLERMVLRYPLQWFNFFDVWHVPAKPDTTDRHE